MKFSQFWKEYNDPNYEILLKASLSDRELSAIRKKITELQGMGKSSSEIVTSLQRFNPKLSEKWKAQRAYWTEVKQRDTKIVGKAIEELDIEKFKVVLSPDPCPICVKKTNNGTKIFKSSDIQKGGYGHVPPFHPNCYCIVIPQE